MDPLKITIIAPEFPGLSITFILNEIAALLDKGHDVSVISRTRGPLSPLQPVVEKYGMLSRTIYIEPEKTGISLALDKIKKIAPEFLKNRIRLARNIVAGPEQSREEIYRHNLEKFFIDLKSKGFAEPHVILCHFGPCGRDFAFLKRMFPASLFLTKFHGYDASRVLKQEPEDYYKDLFDKADLILTCNKFFQPLLIERGAYPNKLEVHHYGVNLDDFNLETKILSSGEPVRILSVARLTEKKGIHVALKAMHILKSRGVPFSYRVIGDGPERTKLKKMIRNLGLENEVFLAGPKDSKVIIRELANAHINLMPSVTASDGDMEGIPVILMEAMASKTMVVATRHSGIPELIEDGVNGCLVQEGNHEDLAEGIIKVLKESASWPEKAEAGRKKVVEEFEIYSQTDRLLEMIRELMEQKRRAND